MRGVTREAPDFATAEGIDLSFRIKTGLACNSDLRVRVTNMKETRLKCIVRSGRIS